MPISSGELLDLAARFDWETWSRERMAPGYEAIYRDLVLKTGKASAKALDASDKWRNDDPFISRFMTKYVGERIVQLEETTKSEVSDLLARVMDEAEGLSTQELADLVGETVRDKFDDYEQYRALRIARTETGFAYNHGTVLGASQAGYKHMLVHDGVDDDDACKEANGQIWPVERCLDEPLEHPNCERAFSPADDDDDEAA